MNKAICTIVLSFLLQMLSAQTMMLPPLDSLLNSLTEFTLKERDSKLISLDTKKTAAWKELLPNLGITYTVTGKPRPSASWSPLQLLDRRDVKNKKKAEIQSIHLAYELMLQDRLHKLKQLHRVYLIDVEMFESETEILTIERKLFEIEEEKYNKHIIKPSTFLNAKKRWLDIKAKRKLEELNLEKEKHALLYFAKWAY